MNVLPVCYFHEREDSDSTSRDSKAFDGESEAVCSACDAQVGVGCYTARSPAAATSLRNGQAEKEAQFRGLAEKIDENGTKTSGFGIVEVGSPGNESEQVQIGVEGYGGSLRHIRRVEIGMALEKEFKINVDKNGADAISTVLDAAELIKKALAKAV
ncbi:hypothetical protein L7F22_021423 [Adiantum nelumboides]|nr:hypothetical protein [Adiantum nelumboides]